MLQEGLNTKFVDEPLRAWFWWVGAMILFLIAWNSIIKLTLRGVQTVAENV